MLENEREIFEELNRRLKEKEIDLTVICVGGFVLSHYGLRTTHDIDGFFKTNREITNIIREVGEKFGINSDDELWLNNSVQNLNEVPDESICEVLYSMSNLNVLVPPLDYIAGMKLNSSREQDVKDVAEIISFKNISSPEVLAGVLKEYGFQAIDESVLLEAFGEAYGMEWLEKYYIENEGNFNF